TTETTASKSAITIPSPPALPAPPATPETTGWEAYVMGPGDKNYSFLGSSTIGQSIVFSAWPTGSASTPPALPFFCSYHSDMNVNGTEVAYLVQPWTAMTQCDEPDSPPVPQNPPPDVLAQDVGVRLVSPLSQSQIASIVDPWFDGWFALGGAEIDDNRGCVP